MDLNTQVLSEISVNMNVDGFDLQAGESWTYPLNYSLRKYQFNIVLEALYKNTLVSLPTGLGKTFIAAVVMYNYYRWYPSSKIIFMAPTKPLVKQQMDACYNIMAIPKETTIELTGTKAQASRTELWINKRVFFVTPQVLQNDLDSIPELAKQIKCLVIDEAHKAKGNHAYCEVIRKILVYNKLFRVLALSATPGNTVKDVVEVVNNLLISHLEIRTDDSPDIIPYIFQRTLETVVVPLTGKLQEVKNSYLQILEKYTRILLQHGVISGNCANMSKGRIFIAMKEFKEKHKHDKVQAYADIMRNLNLCITLYHGYELLTKHGLRGFLHYFEEHSEKALLRGNVHLLNIISDLRDYLGPRPNIEILPDGRFSELSPHTKFGHPKFYKLQDILLKHFSEPDNAGSKAIVFTEYRDSVMEIYALLAQHTPTIKPKYFLGQASITQKQQVNAIKAFRLGECNTLISTCIGEEGLDIGEVDLIVCFDISNKSPVRIVQRMGRTGRKKAGKVIILVSEGKEEETLKECLMNKQYVSNHILKSNQLNLNLYKDNPRMIPDNKIPTCQKIHISVPSVTTKIKGGNIKDMFNNMANKKSALLKELEDIEIVEMCDRLPETVMVWEKGARFMDESACHINSIQFSKRLDSLRVQQPTNVIKHSSNSDILTSLLQYADSRRYNIPVTQIVTNEISNPNKKNKLTRHGSSDNYKQSDIRNMFSKSQTLVSQAIPEDNTDIIHVKEDINIFYSNEIINELYNEISTYMSLSSIDSSNCKICDNLFICYPAKNKTCDIKLEDWILPDFLIIDKLNINDIMSFERKLNSTVEVSNNADLTGLEDFLIDCDDSWNYEEGENKKAIERTHIFTFEAPKSAKKILQTCIKSPLNTKSTENNNSSSSSSNIGNVQPINASFISEDALSFFKLDSDLDLYNIENRAKLDSMNDVIDESPTNVSIKSNDCHNSPILRSFVRTQMFKSNVNRNLFPEMPLSPVLGNTIAANIETPTPGYNKPKLSNLSTVKKSNFFKSNRVNSNLVNKLSFDSEVSNLSVTHKQSDDCLKDLVTNIESFCDLSVFGLETLSEVSNDYRNDILENKATEIKDVSEISNTGSEDLFGSCTNSPEPQKENESSSIVFNIDDSSQNSVNIISHNIAEIVDKKVVFKNHTIEDRESPVLISNICKIYTDVNSWQNFANSHIKCQNITEVGKNVVSKNHTIEDRESPVLISNLDKTSKNKCDDNTFQIDYSDFCDTSFFGIEAIEKQPVLSLTPINRKESHKIKTCLEIENKIDEAPTLPGTSINKNDIDDVCDLSAFGLSETNTLNKTNKKKPTPLKSVNDFNRQGSESPILGSSRAYEKSQSQLPISQILELINKDKSSNEEQTPKRKTQQSRLSTPKTKDTTTTNISISLDLDDENCFEDHELAVSLKPSTVLSTSTQKRQVRAKRKKAFNLYKYDSEDDFEKSTVNDSGWIQAKKEVPFSNKSIEEVPTTKKNRKRKKKCSNNSFIDNEAVLSSNDEDAFRDSSSEDGCSQDVLEASFVDDNTLDIANTTEIHAKYLQTTRSPIRNRGRFKIPSLPVARREILLSQNADYTDNTYLNDTFCVDDDEIDLTQDSTRLSELEKAERILEERRKRKGKQLFNKRNKMPKFKNVIILSDSD